MKEECKRVNGKRYCKIKGKWIRKEEKHRVIATSDSPIKIHKNIRTRKGVC